MLIGRAARAVLHYSVVLNFVAEMVYAGMMLGADTRAGGYGLQLGVAAAALALYMAARRWVPRLRMRMRSAAIA